MLNKVKNTLVGTDYWLLLFAVALSVCGIFAIYSAGFDPSTSYVQTYYIKQSMWLGIGLAGYFIISFIGYRQFVRFAVIIYTIGIIILAVVLIKGQIGMGAQRWINLGPVAIQPSEIFKVVWVITLGWLFIDFTTRKMNLFHIIRKAVLLAGPFLLVFLQPDLGTSLTYIVVFGMVVLYLGITRSTLIILLISLTVAVPVMWNFMHDYQKKRVLTFINPESDPFGSGYHIIQSKIGIGSGGLDGKGYMNGTQSHLKFIPERHTDFIFSVISEEFGMIGGCTILGLFVLLLSRILVVGIRQKEPSGKIICIAVAGYIFFQFVVNSYMVVGMMPVVGIPMPFVSYGGSSIISFFAMLGLVNSVHLKRFKDNE